MSNSTYASYLASVNTVLTNTFNIIGLTLGIPCTLASMFIYARLLRNKNNMGILGIAQSLSDLLVLVVYFILVRSTPFFFPQNSILNRSQFACKMMAYMRRICLHYSSWMNVFTTFDRFVFVLYNHLDHFKFMKRKLILIGLLTAMFLLLTALNTANFLFYLSPSRACVSDFIVTITSDIISICLRTYIPFGLMMLLNVLMIRRIFKTRAALKEISRKEYHFTLAVISFDIYFFVVNLPLSIYYILYDINLYSGAFNNNQLFMSSYNLASTVAQNCAFCAQIFSFFTSIVFNKLFRREILRVFHIATGNAKFTTTFRSHSNTKNSNNNNNTTPSKIT